MLSIFTHNSSIIGVRDKWVGRSILSVTFGLYVLSRPFSRYMSRILSVIVLEV